MRPVFSPAELERYGRQILIDEIGPTGQEKLKTGRIRNAATAAVPTEGNTHEHHRQPA